jgi:hypothetical protein
MGRVLVMNSKRLPLDDLHRRTTDLVLPNMAEQFA